MARVHVIDSVFKEYPSKWKLCFQWCLYDYENGKSDKGFRFIWKTPEGKLQAARGQARIPDIDAIHELTEQAKKAGWAYKGDEKTIYVNKNMSKKTFSL